MLPKSHEKNRGHVGKGMGGKEDVGFGYKLPETNTSWLSKNNVIVASTWLRKVEINNDSHTT